MWAAGMLLGGACSVIKPEASIERTPQACCTWGDFQLQHFKGCRIPTRDCRASKGERYWMRGYVTCGPVDEANCDGGRCCSYKPQYADDLAEPIENWSPPGFAEPTNNVTGAGKPGSTEPGPPPEPREGSPAAPAPDPAPDPAPPRPEGDLEAPRPESDPAPPRPEDDPEAPLPPG
jgi:hypothetical protein